MKKAKHIYPKRKISLDRFLGCLERSYGNCRLEGAEVEYIGNEQEFIDEYQQTFNTTVIIPKEGLRTACDNFYIKWNIRGKGQE